jgi:hypothetical protein
LVVRDPNEENAQCDLIVDFKDMGPQRISYIHLKLMALQYPLLLVDSPNGISKISYIYEKFEAS